LDLLSQRRKHPLESPATAPGPESETVTWDDVAEEMFGETLSDDVTAHKPPE